MIKIKTNEEIEGNKSCILYDNTGDMLGIITSGLIFTDVCVQIKQQQLSGYYILYDGVKTEIEKDGRVMWKTEKPFTASANMLREIILG